MMTCWPNAVESAGEINRATKSGAPPGGFERRRTGRVGYACARAGDTTAATKAMPRSAVNTLPMWFHFLCVIGETAVCSQLDAHWRVIAPGQQIEDLGRLYSWSDVVGDEDVIHARCIEPPRTSVEPRIRAFIGVALAPDVDQAVLDQLSVQLGPCTRMRLFRSQSRIRILRGTRNVPVACHDHAAAL